jgi:hypothetical protein
MADRQDTHWRYAAAARLAGCLLAGCGTARPAAAPASPNPTATLAAGTPHPVPGTAALIAITGAGTRARGYLCDGTPAGR